MLDVSFAWTLDALLVGHKTVTRRFWSPDHAAKFRPGDLFGATDKLVRNGGRRQAENRVVSIRPEPLSRLLDDPVYGAAELLKEGGLWPSVEAFLAQFGDKRGGAPYRLEFALVNVLRLQAELRLGDADVQLAHAEFCRITGQAARLSLVVTSWRELLGTHAFTVDDVAAVARYLTREVAAGRRLVGCLKLGNFTSPSRFDEDLQLARAASRPRRSPAPTSVQTARRDGDVTRLVETNPALAVPAPGDLRKAAEAALHALRNGSA